MPVRRFLCGTCDEVHTGFPDIVFAQPAFVDALPRMEQALWERDRNRCRRRRPAPGWRAALARWAAQDVKRLLLGRHGPWDRWGMLPAMCFCRAVLRVPVRDPEPGDNSTFGFGPWVRLSEADFLAERDRPGGLAPFEGELATELPGYPGSMGLRVSVTPGAEGERPLLWCLEERSELARDQREGITTARAMEIDAASGVRSHWLGPEGGTVEADVEYDGAARLTLERREGGGWTVMWCVHGIGSCVREFGGGVEARAAWEELKPGVARVVDSRDALTAEIRARVLADASR